jgi:quinol monooxygenase YgiN
MAGRREDKDLRPHGCASEKEKSMSGKSLLGVALAALMLSPSGVIFAGEAKTPFVRIAELEIDPVQLESYKAAVKEEIETSIRVEPGVLAIYSVALKEDPSQLRFFEIYKDEAAYTAHIASPHFRKYVEITKGMIKSRKLLGTVPIQLSAKQ